MGATERPSFLATEPVDLVVLFALLAWGVALLAPGLSSPLLLLWDEAMHQAATRGAYETFLRPHLYEEHLYPFDVRHFWSSEVWMHKPPGPFWFGALVMKGVGVTPAALRFGSLLGHLFGGAALYLLARPLAGRLAAALAAATFLALPFGWLLVQGLFFGDATDCTLLGFNALAMVCLAWSVERQSWRAAAVAGAAVGFGFLCKVTLALTPLGVAGVLWLLGRLGVCKGPRLSWVLLMGVVALAVALPYNVYAAIQFPDAFWVSVRTTFAHLMEVSGPASSYGPWARPADAIFVEIHHSSLRPIPAALTLVAGLWLALRACVRREWLCISLALWVWATWITLSLATVKVPAAVWGAVPGIFAALAMLLADGLRYPVLGATALGAALTPILLPRLPALAKVRELAPDFLVQARQLPGPAEGVFLAACALALAGPLWLLVRRHPRWARPAFAAPLLLVAAWLFVEAPLERAKLEAQHAPRRQVTYLKEVGLAVDAAVPERSVLFLDVEGGVPEAQLNLDALFWSGRIAYQRPPDLATARARGYHPYLLSPAAEPYAPVPGVPPHAWLRAYDLERPTSAPAPLPPGVLRLEASVDGLRVLGVASGPAGTSEDRWAFYVHAPAQPSALRVVFHTAEGPVERAIAPEKSLRAPHRLTGTPWFVLPTLGPRRDEVSALEFGSGLRVTLSSP